MAKQLQIGDKVAFTAAVINRCGHAPAIAAFRGEVQAVEGRIVRTVDTNGMPKTVPTANLAKVQADGSIIDLP